jgi:putative hydrolase of the HAD superfamily
MPNTIQAVLFDMDETLLIHDRNFRELTADLFTAFEQQLPDIEYEKFAKALWTKAVDMWHMMYDGVVPGTVARRYTILNTLRQLEADLDLTNPMMETWDELFVSNTRMMPDAESVLAEMRSKGLRLGIVTNGYSDVQHQKIKQHQLEPMVDFVLVSEDAKSHKPDPGIFEQALKRAGTPAAATMFVGDMPNTDIEGALATGMIPVLMDPKDTHADGLPKHREPHFRIRTLEELLPLLSGPEH